jgi:hypothetical protein
LGAEPWQENQYEVLVVAGLGWKVCGIDGWQQVRGKRNTPRFRFPVHALLVPRELNPSSVLLSMRGERLEHPARLPRSFCWYQETNSWKLAIDFDGFLLALALAFSQPSGAV